MINRDIFVRDPLKFKLLNNGVAKVGELASHEEELTLRHELETFVCEGQYEKGLERIVRTFLDNLDQPEQPAVWISGFFGSGKSHLVKMLRYLWVNYAFPDGATALGLTDLPVGVSDLFKELDTVGKRYGGLHALSGTLRAGAGDSVRLALLGLVFKSAGLPEQYPLARFLLWLQQEGKLEAFRTAVEASGKDFEHELRNLYVSPVVAESLMDVFPHFTSTSEVRSSIKQQFPNVTDVSLDEMVQAVHDALSGNGVFPCTLITLDEVQQYIGDNSDRTYAIQEVTQACASRFGGKLMFVATGQTALADTPQLSKLTGRFFVKVQLSDTDVVAVTRKTVLAKQPTAQPEVEKVLEACSGEISRHLAGSKFEPRGEDGQIIVADYPLLPTRRRFWEQVLRVVDSAGTAGQLRTQLKIVDEAVKTTAEAPLGTVVGGDFLYDQIRKDLLHTGILVNELDTRIEGLRDSSPTGELDARICALVFLIGKLPRESGSDTGLRATPDVLADLLVTDLHAGSSTLRQQVTERLKELTEDGPLMQVHGEYRIQTRESAAWEGHFRDEYRRTMGDPQRLAAEREDALRLAVSGQLKGIGKILHGASKEPRQIQVSFSKDEPAFDAASIPVWIRNGWNDTEASILADARQAGTGSPLVYVFLPNREATELTKALAEAKAASTTLSIKGRPSSGEGIEARRAMETRLHGAEQARDVAIGGVLQGAKVFLAGGQEYVASALETAVHDAAHDALKRMFPRFDVADDARWRQVLKRAKNGDGDALKALDYKGSVDQHPVCAAVLKETGAGKKGSELRKHFEKAPYGWPRDVVDAALLMLAHNSLVRVTQNGQPADLRTLDQTKIGVAEFRAEQVTLTTIERIKVRQLFQGAGVTAHAGEESVAASLFLARLREMAERAGGSPPLPELPAPPLLAELEALSGNEQLARLHAERNTLNHFMSEWGSAVNLANTRLPRWENLQHLLRHADSLAEAQSLRDQAEAIRTQRTLLQHTDPVQPLLQQATDLLRKALADLHARYTARYQEERQALEATDVWQKLSTDQQQDILRQRQIDEVPAIDVGDEKALLRSLDEASLETWKTRLDALSVRFGHALIDAARLLEPSAVRVYLPSATLSSEEDVDAWLQEARQKILQQLAEGPVIV